MMGTKYKSFDFWSRVLYAWSHDFFFCSQNSLKIPQKSHWENVYASNARKSTDSCFYDTRGFHGRWRRWGRAAANGTADRAAVDHGQLQRGQKQLPVSLNLFVLLLHSENLTCFLFLSFPKCRLSILSTRQPFTYRLLIQSDEDQENIEEQLLEEDGDDQVEFPIDAALQFRFDARAHGGSFCWQDPVRVVVFVRGTNSCIFMIRSPKINMNIGLIKKPRISTWLIS